MARITLKNVRLSFPSIFNRSSFEGKDGKYQATLLIDKSDEKTKQLIDASIATVLAASGIKVPKQNYCIIDGDESEYDGYGDHWSLKAANSKRPVVIDRDKTPLTEDDNIVYAGCYVNAIIDFWIQNNTYGKRVNGNLYGIQFVKDGEPFGLGAIDVTEDFDDLDDLNCDGADDL